MENLPRKPFTRLSQETGASKETARIAKNYAKYGRTKPQLCTICSSAIQ
jgi:hypothetical protein